MKVTDNATFFVRFAPDVTKSFAEAILKENCCQVDVHTARVGNVGATDFCIVVADLCLCCQDAMRNDGRILYWEQMVDLTPVKSCCQPRG